MIWITFFNNQAVKNWFLLLNSLTNNILITNKPQNIYTKGKGVKNTPIKKWVINYFKIKFIPFIIKFKRNYAIRYQRSLPVLTVNQWDIFGRYEDY